MKSQLLPEGFRDSLPDLAGKEFQISSAFLNLMKRNGYFFIKPPLLEFESSLFFLTNDKDNIDSFRLLDPISQKMMGIRPDITLQVARIACGSLHKSPRPLRMCYSGEILKAKNNGLNLSRQITQIGSEIIGIENNFCEKELIDLIIETLKILKIKKFFINFTMPTLIESLSKDFKLSKFDLDFVKERYKNKNYSGIEKISKKLESISKELLNVVGLVNINIKKLKKIKFPKKTQIEINNFIKIVDKIKKRFPDLDLYMDPLEIDESNYHTGLAFKVFSENLKELFTGGNYKVFEENCIGFSGYLENLVKESTVRADNLKKIFVNENLSDSSKKKLQNKGFIIVKAIKKLNTKQIKKNAKIHNCEFYLNENKILRTD
ncbi:MAG: ATP phosphoribosyltransferase regulatory subunit [Pseudomonadota bacterium]|nr:ATP phosphoribosyltransferase regulatory subunit [Pseudomonadota bacterium]